MIMIIIIITIIIVSLAKWTSQTSKPIHVTCRMAGKYKPLTSFPNSSRH